MLPNYYQPSINTSHKHFKHMLLKLHNACYVTLRIILHPLPPRPCETKLSYQIGFKAPLHPLKRAQRSSRQRKRAALWWFYSPQHENSNQEHYSHLLLNQLHCNELVYAHTFRTSADQSVFIKSASITEATNKQEDH